MDETTSTTTSSKDPTSSPSKPPPRQQRRRQVLYRFATDEKDPKSAGICVVLGDWTAVDDKSSDTSNSSSTLLHTTVTCFLLPTQSQQTALQPSTLLQLPLSLKANEWSLLGISHNFPYLKRPQFCITVNGTTQGIGELTYPVVDNGVIFEYATLFGNMGGNVRVVGTREDDKLTASQLATPQSTSTTTTSLQQWQVASVALHPDAIPSNLQALLADAGVCLSLQQQGRIVVPLAPISNSSKGSSLDGGPSTGTPLVNFGQLALDLQRSVSRVVCFMSAANAIVLKTRLVCPMKWTAGHYEDLPKVGLVQPSLPLEVDASISFVGNLKVVHALSEYLLEQSEPNLDTNILESVPHLSVVLLEQQLVELLVLPFFLSLAPPGHVLKLQQALYKESLKQLYALYSRDGEWAATLIDLLTTTIYRHGGRCHEYILQSGLLNALGTCLRLSLVRAQLLKVSDYASGEEFVVKTMQQQQPEATTNLALSPKKVPTRIAQAIATLMDACCGPVVSQESQKLSSHYEIRRQSDLAMTAVFSLGLDLDLWGVDVNSAKLVVGAVAARYGTSIAHGAILRHQVPVQSLLDQIRIRLDILTPQLEDVANSFSQLVETMLLSSLTNRRNIVMAEHDVSACIGALSDCALGTVGAHVVLTALVRILEWCDICPNTSTEKVSDDAKLQVATRLGRNLLMGQYHDVVAPMLLSRTVFCGERMITSSGNSNPHLWQYHWRLSLLLFVVRSKSVTMCVVLLTMNLTPPFRFHFGQWVSSISGPEGEVAAKSTGSLLFASGLAGSLKGCLLVDNHRDTRLMATLLLPPPALALTVNAANNRNSNRNDSWSYTDLLSDRLQIMMPLLPGLIVSLISHPADVTADTGISADCLKVLNELLFAVTSSFRRVFGESRSPVGASSVLKTAKTHAPHLLMVIMLLESHIFLRKEVQENEEVVILKCRKPQGDGDWVDVDGDRDTNNGVVYGSPAKDKLSEKEALVKQLVKCQRMVMNALTDLIINAMRLGGGEASTIIWRNVVTTLKDSVLYGTVSTLPKEENDAQETSDTPNTDLSSTGNSDDDAQNLAQNILCRLSAIVLTKAQKRSYEWELWTPELSAAVSRICVLAEEKELLQKPLAGTAKDPVYSRDQILLLCALLDVMEYGREMTGWCQLILPTPPAMDLGVEEKDQAIAAGTSSQGEGYVPTDLYARSPEPKGGRSTFVPQESPSASSRSLLPALQPTLRAVLACVGNIKSSIQIFIPQVKKAAGGESTENADVTMKKSVLLLHMTVELKQTLTAAIVGLSFPNARDVALSSLAALRRANIKYRNTNDTAGLEACAWLFVVIVEEIRVRYEGERRLREKALFDAYEDDQDVPTRSFDIEASREVERMILGGDLIPKSTKGTAESGETEEISFADGENSSERAPLKQNKSDVEGEDFILFHEAFGKKNSDHRSSQGTKMGYSDYEGLGSTLEECKMLMATVAEADKPKEESAQALLALLTPFLDTWDENDARDAADSELVELFNAAANIDGSKAGGSKGTEPKFDMTLMQAQLPIFGSETAADAMSTFIEISSGEKSRLNEVISTYMPSHRSSCIAYAERFCWAKYMEITKEDGEFSMDSLWERGIADGNRDIRSRLISMPCPPQFPRHIPSYLDNTASITDKGGSRLIEDATGSDDGADRDDVLDDVMKRSSITKLMAAGNIEILDITKKEIDENELLDLPENWGDGEGLIDENEDDIMAEGGIIYPESDESSQQGAVDNSERPGDADAVEPSTSDQPDASLDQDDHTGRAVDKAHLSSFHHLIASTCFSDPPDNSASMLSLLHSATPGVIEEHFDNCIHVKTEGNRKGTLLLTATHLILEYDADAEGWFDGEMLAVQEETDRQRMIVEGGGGDSGRESLTTEEKNDEAIQRQLEQRQRESAALRPKSIRWNLSELSHVYLRRYRLRDSALEMFFLPSGGSSFGGFGLYSPGTSVFLDFGPGHEGNIFRDAAANSIMRRAPAQAITQWPDRSSQFLHEQLSRLTMGWVDGRITNFDYLLHLNMLAGRSYNDLCQYPVLPWVLSNYTSEEIPDLSDRSNYRDLSKPMGALNPERLNEFIERFESFSDPTIPPFMYGSHYSTSAGVVLHFLVRMHPFAGLHRQLQGGHFDVADRIFSSVPRTWEMCTGRSAAEVKELTPEWYCNPAFLKNTNKFKLGTSQEGELLGDVALPPWASGSPEKFVEVMRNALESDICSEMLPDWIDLIFGRCVEHMLLLQFVCNNLSSAWLADTYYIPYLYIYRKQQGPESIKAHNVFFYLTYYGSVDVASIEDESLRTATELQIAHFGQCPMQLFKRPHVRRVQRISNYRKLSFYQMLSAYSQGAGRGSDDQEKNDGSEEDTPLKRKPSLKLDGSQRLFGEPLFLPFFSAPISHWVHLDAPPPGPHAALIALRLAGIDRVLAIDAHGIFHSFRWAWKAEMALEDEEGSPEPRWIGFSYR